MTVTPSEPERRKDDALIDYRLREVEKDLDKQLVIVNGVDAKLDALRADLFERAIFVNINQMQLELQSRDNKISNLQAALEDIGDAKENQTNLYWVKAGIGASLFVGILGVGIAAISLLLKVTN